MTVLAFDSYNEGRADFKELLNAAEDGRLALVCRDESPSAVVVPDRLRTLPTDSITVHPSVVVEAGGWSATIPAVAVAADGASFGEALEEYAEDWRDHLLDAHDHLDSWALVQLASLSDDQRKKRPAGGSA